MLACECGAKTQVRIFLTITSWLTIAYYSVSINIFRTTSTYRDTFHRSLIGTTTYGIFLSILVLLSMVFITKKQYLSLPLVRSCRSHYIFNEESFFKNTPRNFAPLASLKN